jgi:uncharacterized protein (DUF433 family)
MLERIFMRNVSIQIIDRGRGPQLSTNRITVLDLIPYFRRGADATEIIHWMPSLSPEEIGVAESYYRSHQPECDAMVRAAQTYRNQQVELQRARFPEMNGTPEERLSRLRSLVTKRRQERNGEGHSG